MQRVKTTLKATGRVAIPLEYRQALGIEPGDQLVLALESGELHVLTPRQRFGLLAVLNEEPGGEKVEAPSDNLCP